MLFEIFFISFPNYGQVIENINIIASLLITIFLVIQHNIYMHNYDYNKIFKILTMGKWKTIITLKNNWQ